MAKSLRDITGTKASKVVKLNHKDMYQWNSPDGLEFVDDKHPVDKHEDRVGNGDDVYKGKTKEASYKRQSDGVYEEVEELDEISRKLAGRYIKKASGDLDSLSHELSHGNTKKAARKIINRYKGIDKAVDKATGTENKYTGPARVSATEEVEIDEANKENKAKKNIIIQKLGAGEKKTARTPALRKGRELLKSFKECSCEDGCNSSPKGMKCEVHGEEQCPSYTDKKGRKLLTDKKKAWEAIEIGKALRVGNHFSDTHLAREKRNPNSLGKPANLLDRANKTIGKLKGSTFMVKKMTEEEQIDELSMKTLASYVKKATDEMGKIAKKAPENRTFKDTDKYLDRSKGVSKAKEKISPESGGSSPATKTEYTGPGAAGWTTGRLDVGTL